MHLTFLEILVTEMFYQKVTKREVLKDTSDSFNDFLVEKLTEHSQALQHLVEKVDRQEEITRQLIEHLSKSLEKPKLPTKVETIRTKEHIQRRSNTHHMDRTEQKMTENPLLRLGKNIPVYGRLAKDILMEEIRSETDPTPLLERVPDKRIAEVSAMGIS